MSFADSNAFAIAPPAAGAPAWATSQTDKTWIAPATSFETIRDVLPSSIPIGSNSPAGLVEAWSSGRYGTYNDHPGYFHNGGGHVDYSGNEVYFFDLIDQRWYRITNPSTDVSGSGGTSYNDGKPRAVHTYGHIVWTPGFLWMMGQAGPYPDDGTSYSTWRLNLSTLAWALTTSDWPDRAFDGVEAASYYSPSRGVIYTLGQPGEIWSTNVSTAVMTHISSDVVTGGNLHSGSAFSEDLGALFYFSENGDLSAFDVANPGSGWRDLTISGTFSISEAYPGMLWHPGSKKLIFWGNTTGLTSVKTLSPPTATPTTFSQLLGTWPAATVTATGGGVTPDGPPSGGQGVHKRFDLMEDPFDIGRDWLFLFNNIDESPKLYKLPAAGL